MKFCPTCQTRYDEEIIRFCTKDGTPLIEEEQPQFIAMPSESLETADEADGEETVIRRKDAPAAAAPISPPSQDAAADQTGENAQRLVIPTSEPVREEQQVRTKPVVVQQPPPKKSNTTMVVLLTFLGTLAVLAGAAGVYWIFSNDKNAADTNQNVNLNANIQDTNINTNLNIDGSLFNLNTNTNVNVNTNANANANVKTPTPSPSRTPTPSPTPSPGNQNTNTNANANVSPTRTPSANTSPTATPSPRATPSPTSRPVNVGNLNSRAVNLARPSYPTAARAVKAEGRVPVQVLVDEGGNVLSARATSGHPLLRQAAESAARQSKFNPAKVNGKNVQSIGTVVYNFVNQ